MKTTSHQWLEFFERNASRVLDCAADSYALTEAEYDCIAGSICKFQIGEASEGALLKCKAQAHAQDSGDEIYPKLIQFLIREENRHSAYLGQFMRRHHIRFCRSTWTDKIFRKLRNLAGLELSIRTLVTAEIVAVSYYAALAVSTKSPALRAICERMQEEELEHIRFQMMSIHQFALERSPFVTALYDIFHAFIVATTVSVAGWEHRQVIRSRQSLKEFFYECYDRFRESMDDGRSAAGVQEPSWLEVVS